MTSSTSAPNRIISKMSAAEALWPALAEYFEPVTSDELHRGIASIMECDDTASGGDAHLNLPPTVAIANEDDAMDECRHAVLKGIK